ncbi:dual specificity protein phosphatase family protein [Brevundimonas sp. 2YAF1]|uniref:dual specificity protein phosphatase family protein n=1 Tax=Brevundimonas sp. 2YAF1 TaxID=3233024 RepID=UPI003F8F61DD
MTLLQKTGGRLKRPLQVVGFVVGASLVAILAYAAVLMATGNFHTVVAGELYRSAQPSGASIAAYQREHGVRAILNLRGENPHAAWYRNEVAAARRLGIQHIDFRMSARRGITKEEAWRLIDVMEQAPKPLLIHCESGADRSGLASALYLAAVKRYGEEIAERQLSIRYGHIASPAAKGWGMTVTFEDMEPSLGFPES